MNPPTLFQWLTFAAGIVILVFLGGLGCYLIWAMWADKIDLSKLISEPNGDASMSRLQFLIFTFVIALSLFLVIMGAQPVPAFPAVIPGTVFVLLGISGSSYLVSKSIQFSDPAGLTPPQKGMVITPDKPVLHVGQTQQFEADLMPAPDKAPTIKWEVIMGYGQITQDGLYTADVTKGPAIPAGSTLPAPAMPVHATIQATVDGQPDLYDLAVVTILA